MTCTTVMFDMDGTLLDLAFDDFIWNQHIPQAYADIHNKPIDEAHEYLQQLYQQHRHTLNWYSTEFWTQKLGLNILEIHNTFEHKIQPRTGCFDLLNNLKQKNYECWLVTNADHKNLALKLEKIGLSPYFKHIISSETIGFPKEDIRFWEVLQKKYHFNHQTCAFVDDTEAVLKQAGTFGISKLFIIPQPSSKTSTRFSEHAHYHTLHDLIALPNYL